MDALLEQASSVFVHLDPRREKVVVPPQFRKQPMLVLEIGLNMRVPIPDLEVDDEGIGCTLSFGGRKYWCQMPWHAVFALVTGDQRGMVWPPDVPAEVAYRFAPEGGKSKTPKKTSDKPGPRLVSVPDRKDEESDTSESTSDKLSSQRSEKPSNPPKLSTVDGEKSQEEESLDPAPSMDGNAAAVLDSPDDSSEEPDDPDDSSGKAKRKLPPYLRVVK